MERLKEQHLGATLLMQRVCYDNSTEATLWKLGILLNREPDFVLRIFLVQLHLQIWENCATHKSFRTAAHSNTIYSAQ